MNSYYYDSHFAFEVALHSLGNLNRLVTERRKAGYERNERLQEWILLGRYSLDTCGNSMKFIGESIPAIVFPGIPPILTRQEFDNYVKEHSSGKEYYFSASIGDDIPQDHLFCPECYQGWTLQNCHDTVVRHESKVISLNNHAGKTLLEIKEEWNKLIDAIWVLQPDCSIRNDRYIDHTIVAKSKAGSHYDREKNPKGWIAPNDDYMIQPGDEAMVNIWTYRHYSCHRKSQLESEKVYFQEIFTKAGYKHITLTETQNEYCNCERCAPWFNVTADGVQFLIGWRKREINIESTNTRIDFANLFYVEDVTKGENFIHAWSKQKCIEYLQTIRNVVTV